MCRRGAGRGRRLERRYTSFQLTVVSVESHDAPTISDFIRALHQLWRLRARPRAWALWGMLPVLAPAWDGSAARRSPPPARGRSALFQLRPTSPARPGRALSALRGVLVAPPPRAAAPHAGTWPGSRRAAPVSHLRRSRARPTAGALSPVYGVLGAARAGAPAHRGRRAGAHPAPVPPLSAPHAR